MQIDATNVPGSSERRIDVPAAVSVITGEDVRRYGVDTAITNDELLVTIDGRSVHTPLFGVFREAQHVMMSDIDRIEVIRGPAAVMWGPNAIDGAINIITKR